MKRSSFVAQALTVLPLCATVGAPFYVAGAGGVSTDLGATADVLQLNSINLGAESGDAAARFGGLATTSFADGASGVTYAATFGVLYSF